MKAHIYQIDLELDDTSARSQSHKRSRHYYHYLLTPSGAGTVLTHSFG